MIQIQLAEERDDELGPARDMTRQDFLLAFDSVRQYATDALISQGAFSPTVLLPSLNESGIVRVGLMPVEPLVSDPQSKNILAELLAKLIEDPNHDFCIFAHEAWVLAVNADDPEAASALRAQAQLGSLEHHPQRGEALMIHIRSKDDQAFCMLPIERDASGSIVEIKPGELQFLSDSVSLEGRFSAPGSSRLQ